MKNKPLNDCHSPTDSDLVQRNRQIASCLSSKG